jgi:hypothetical protein
MEPLSVEIGKGTAVVFFSFTLKTSRLVDLDVSVLPAYCSAINAFCSLINCTLQKLLFLIGVATSCFFPRDTKLLLLLPLPALGQNSADSTQSFAAKLLPLKIKKLPTSRSTGGR